MPGLRHINGLSQGTGNIEALFEGQANSLGLACGTGSKGNLASLCRPDGVMHRAQNRGTEALCWQHWQIS